MENKIDPTIDPSTQTPAPEKKIIRTKLKERISKLPEQKRHLDFIAALLTIPLLAITLYLNVTTLKNKNATPTPTPTNKPQSVNQDSQKIVSPIVITTKPQPTVSQEVCVKDIGPIDIAFPQEGQIVNTNPVCIDITYQAGNYCSVVWAYKINNSSLSDYSNNSVCLYNLPQGTNTFELQVKSLVSPSTKTLHRNFLYKSNEASPTAQLSPANTTPGTQ